MRLRAIHDAVLFGSIAFFAAYVAPQLVSIPLPWYLPLAREWTFAVKPPGLGMAWYGLTAFAAAIGLFAAGAAWIASRSGGAALSASRARAGVFALAIAAIAAMGIYVAELAVRVPKPEPLPSWYQPK